MITNKEVKEWLQDCKGYDDYQIKELTTEEIQSYKVAYKKEIKEYCR